jgi:hypothetical protein
VKRVKVGNQSYWFIKKKAFWGSDYQWEAHSSKPDVFSDISYVMRSKTEKELKRKLRGK